MHKTTRERFTFHSEGETLVGNLFVPADAKPAGVVITVGPLTSVKEQAGGTYAQAMAERGFGSACASLPVLWRERRSAAAV